MIPTIAWQDDYVVMIDQRKLPFKESYVVCKTPAQVISAIRNMVIRGAPAIGVAAAMGLALGAHRIKSQNRSVFERRFRQICEQMGCARPTASNLFWAIESMQQVVTDNPQASVEELKQLIRKKADEVLAEDQAINQAIGHHGQVVVPDGATVLTHCNAGALATAGYGTALGVVRAAWEAGKNIQVLADETRPFLQGSRLTAWELQQDNIPVTLITDNMAGYLMSQGRVQLIVVGADRVAANGDVANKIGTYSVAVLAKENKVPFYVAAPLSTVDLSVATGKDIPIEERDPKEVTHSMGRAIAPHGVSAWNPAFDVTPNRLIHGIITEKGIARKPYKKSLKAMKTQSA
ncbi:MAG: S-methyl-5-thioribose-1-phosphate isomerase [Deltaproteobacteria bacterium]|nr:MAG: S-methyl-5-thioribose-1-phosphate isomerase [Deltaproteobacteria bacterium]